ncbi:MAG TPA: hypothetical protein EYN41_05590 [Flavobacteriales bacterium]|nr:hypothetical protein [Flavobacteriales bacterium]
MRFNSGYGFRRPVAILMCFLFAGTSCVTGPEDVDVSHIGLELEVRRFEQSLFELDIDSLDHGITEIEAEYGSFFTFFAAGSINIGRRDNPSFNNALMGFVDDPQIKDVMANVSEAYEDIDDIEVDLEDAFRRYMHYFPGKPVPQVVTYISGFNSSLITTDKVLGIGLDMYLGTDCEYYKRLFLPQYKIENMKRELIVADCMRGWLTSDMELDNNNSTMLRQMIYHGKVLYYLDLVAPTTEDQYKIGYTKEQLQWCHNNEAEMWAHLVDVEMLYSTDFTQVIKYIGEAPFTVGFPEGSPGRTGWWIGWQIVRSFMENNEAISLAELMQIEDEQQILSKSKYKPNR